MVFDKVIHMIKISCTIIFLLVTINVYCVPKIQIQRNSIETMTDLWNLQIVSDFNTPKIINIKITAYNKFNVLLYEASTENFVLQTGISNFGSNQISLVRVKYSNEEILNDNEIIVVVSMTDPMSYAELFQYRQSIRINKEYTNKDDTTTTATTKNKIKKYIDAGGSIALTGLYNTRKDTLFYMPFDYFRLETHHQINLMGLPFIYDMYVTTEQKYTTQRLNSYSFKFDYDKFKQQLLTKLKQKVERIEKLGNVSQLLDKQQLTQSDILDSLKNNKFLKAEYIEKYKEYTAIDSLKNYLGVYDEVTLKKNITVLSEYAKIDSVQKKFEEIEKQAFQKIDTSDYKNRLNSLSDTALWSSNNKYGSILDSVKLKKDSLTYVYDSVFQNNKNKYEKLLSKYGGNKDSLDNFLNSIKSYNVQDLMSFSKLKHMVNDKISSYEKYYNAKELEKLKEIKDSDIRKLEGQLKDVSSKYNLLEKRELLISGLKHFDIGTVYPSYTNYTVNGVILNGYNINYNYKKLYTSFSGGKQLNIISDSISSFVQMKKPMLFVFAFGYGDKFDNHIHLNYSYGSRIFRNNLLNQDFISKNHVLSPDFSYRLFKNKLFITGEFPVSVTSRQTTGDNEKETGFANYVCINGIITKNTSIEINAKYLSENFQTYGVPFLFSNYLGNNYKIKQKINKYLNTEVAYNYEKFYENKSIGRVPTDIHTLNGLANLTYKQWNLNATYAPAWFQIKDQTKARNMMHTAGIGINSNYTIRENKQLSSSVGFNYNSFYNSQAFISDFGSILIENNIIQINKNMNIYLIERLNIKNKYTIGLNFYIQKNNFNDAINNNFIIFGINYTQNVNKKLNYAITYQNIKHMKKSMRHNTQIQLNYNINRFMDISTVVWYDNIDGIIDDGNRYIKTNAFQIRTNLVFKM